MLAVLFMLVLILLTLSIAAPTVATDLRRDKEMEAIERGKQYTRAIRLYYRKYGRYPNTIDQLMNTDNQRFLRKRYLDPFTGKDDWRLIHLGEAHTTSTGFFGQPSAQVGTPIGGTPASGTGASPFGSSSGPGGSSSPSTSSDHRPWARQESLGIVASSDRRVVGFFRLFGFRIVRFFGFRIVRFVGFRRGSSGFGSRFVADRQVPRLSDRPRIAASK